MNFYIYENWTAENKARIHRGDCRFCNYGRGIHPDKQEGRNGRWHEAFATYPEAVTAARRLVGRIMTNCKKCQPY